jgi:hypothetical protein
MAAARGDDGPRFGWNEIFVPEEKRLVILGRPGAGKSTLLDYLVLVFTGALKHPLRDRLGRPFPLLARLRELGSEGSETLPALLARSSPLRKVPAGYPERWLKRGGCLGDAAEWGVETSWTARQTSRERGLPARWRSPSAPWSHRPRFC